MTVDSLAAGQVQEIESRYQVALYAKRDIALVRGEGAYLYDSEGRRYLDAMSNYGVAVLGHADPEYAAALSELSGRPISAAVLPKSEWQPLMQRGLSPSLATLIVKANDAQNKPGVVDVEEGVGEVRYGTAELIDALRPLVS